MEKDYLEEQNGIFEKAELEIVLDGEDELIEVISEPSLPEEFRKLITCTCDQCRRIRDGKTTKIISKPTTLKYEKFIKKFVEKTKKSIENDAKSQSDVYKEQLQQTKETIKKLESLGKVAKKVPLSQFKEIEKQYEEISKNLIEKAKEINQKNGAIERVSPEAIRKNILMILRDPNVEEVRESENFLKVKIKRFQIEGFLLGPFVMTIPPVGVINVSKTEDTIISKTGYFHPHVTTDGNICLGNVSSMSSNLYWKQNLWQRFSVTLNLLQNYNAKSPYTTIDNWAPAFCTNCKQGLEYGKEKHCMCGAILCKDCAKLKIKTKCCESEVCPKCSTKCPNCQEIVCDDFVEIVAGGCEKCKKKGCANCIKIRCSCDSLELLCEDCVHKCEECGTVQCLNCAKIEEENDEKFYVCPKGHRNKIREDERIEPIKFDKTKKPVRRGPVVRRVREASVNR